MATTQLTNVYVPLVFDAAVDEAATEKNLFVQSGVMVENPVISNMAAVGGNIGEMPFFAPLATTGEPDYIDDDPAHTATPANISGSKMIYRRADMHKSWSTMDLARELALIDPLAAITAKIGGWWATQRQKRVIQTAMGLLADNVANDAGDMVKDVATDAALPILAADMISADVVIDAAQTLGDAKGFLAAIAMHSVVYTTLQKQNLIDYIPNARGEVNIPTYLGYVVIVDDGMSAVAGANRVTYTSILFAQGAIEYGTGNILLPSELERVPNAGYGGGQDILHTRKADIIHPHGFSFLSANVAGQSATLAELALAANWNRVMARKNIGMAFIQTNG